MDENGQPLFNFDMDAQRKAVFKVDPSLDDRLSLSRCLQVYLEEETGSTNDQRPSITTAKRLSSKNDRKI